MKNLICQKLLFTYGLIISFLFTTLLITGCTKDNPVDPVPSFAEKLQKTLDDGLVKYGGKGISASVIMPDGYQWKGVSGISHGNVKITTDMVFSAGSITKTFTAAAIMRLAEEGKLDLEDSLHKWLPPLPNIDSSITIRQLLNHTNGIFNITEHPSIWKELFQNSGKIWEIEDLVRTYTLQPYFSKGTSWHYSNTGYLLLRMIMQSASGTSIANQYRNRFFDPLGMTRSYLAIEEPPKGQVAHGWFDYNGGDGVYDDLNLIPMNAFYSGAGGGIFCTAEELAVWTKALLGDKIVVSENSLNQMLDFHSPCPGEDMVAGYGLGILTFNPSYFNGLIVIGSGGNAPGYAAGSMYLKDYEVFIGFMDNTEKGDAMPVINDLLNVVLNELKK